MADQDKNELPDEDLGRAAYEAWRTELADITPGNGPWDEIAEWHKRAWIAAGRAAANLAP